MVAIDDVAAKIPSSWKPALGHGADDIELVFYNPALPGKHPLSASNKFGFDNLSFK